MLEMGSELPVGACKAALSATRAASGNNADSHTNNAVMWLFDRIGQPIAGMYDLPAEDSDGPSSEEEGDAAGGGPRSLAAGGASSSDSFADVAERFAMPGTTERRGRSSSRGIRSPPAPAPAPAPAPPTFQTLAVTRPPTGTSMMPGQQILVADPQGKKFRTTVPAGVLPGQTFHVRVPVPNATPRVQPNPPDRSSAAGGSSADADAAGGATIGEFVDPKRRIVKRPVLAVRQEYSAEGLWEPHSPPLCELLQHPPPAAPLVAGASTLMEMGLRRGQAERALEASNGDLEGAISMLLGGRAPSAADPPPPPPQAEDDPPHRRTDSSGAPLELRSKVGQLVAMGFTHAQAQAALLQTEGSVEAAATLVVSTTEAEAAVLRRAKSPDHGKNLPEHLTLGLSLAAIEEMIAALPADAVEQCNAQRPIINGVRVEPNRELNGYVNQFHIARASEQDGVSTCERLRARGHPGVGVATIFVSWFLETTLETLVDAMGEYLRMHPDVSPDAKWWVCDFVIRQATRQLAAEDNDVKKLGECVRTIGHTVLLMEPWHDPGPLKRAYCIKEVWHTQASGARFEVVMSAYQQLHFERALLADFDSIQERMAHVDVRNCECRKPEDTEHIKRELDREVGLLKCNQQVHGLLRGALATQGRAALAKQPAHLRGTEMLMNRLGAMLHNQGELEEAEALLREAEQVQRKTLGDKHRQTLSSITDLGDLLRDQGKLEEAGLLLREALQAQRETLGDKDRHTLASINNLALVLIEQGELEEAAPLRREVLQGCRETHGDEHPRTLISINNLGELLQAQGKLEEAGALHHEALQAQRKTLGDKHQHTLNTIWSLCRLLHKQGEEDEAKRLCREAVDGAKEVLGVSHPTTKIFMSNHWGIR